MRYVLFLIVAGLGISLPAAAQQDLYYWRAGVSLGSMNYYGDLGHRIVPVELTPEQLAWGVSVERLISDRWASKLLYSQGQFRANDRIDDKFLERSLNAQTDIRDYTLLFTYYLDNDTFLERKSFLAPYLSVGVGYTDFEVFGDLQDSEGQFYHYWSDYSIRSVAENSAQADQATLVEQDGTYETELSALNTEQAYSTETLSLPLALGLKFRLGDRVNLNLEVMGRFTFTDYLDDVGGDYRAEYGDDLQARAANPTGREATQRGSSPSVNDFYTFSSVSLHYNFSRRSYVYRAPKLYATGERVNLYTTPESRRAASPDTVATLEVSRRNLLQSYQLPDSMQISSQTVGRDTFLTVVRPRVARLDQRQVAGDTLTTVDLPDTLATINRLQPLSDSLAITFSPDSLTQDTLVQMVRYEQDSLGERQAIDTVATFRMNQMSDTLTAVSDSSALVLSPVTDSTKRQLSVVRLAPDTSQVVMDTVAVVRLSDTTRVVPLSDSLTLRLTDSRRDSARLSFAPAPPADSVRTTLPASTGFNPLPTTADSVNRVGGSNNEEGNETTDRLEGEITRLQEQLRQLRENQAVADTTATPDNAMNARRTNDELRPPPTESEDEVPPEVATDSAPAGPPTTVTPPAPADPTLTNIEGEAELTLASSPAEADSAAEKNEATITPEQAQADSLSLDSLNEQIDDFSRYLDKVQENDTSIAAVAQEVRTLRTQLDSLQRTRQSVDQTDSIRRQLRNLELRELRSSRVFFGYASDQVSKTSRERLAQTASFLKKQPHVQVRLRGFTDTSGDPERNQLLSQRRAKAVQQVLVDDGIDPDRITTRYFGADLSLDPEQASYARRVEVILEE